jgi:MoxR-like ATPase
MLNAPMPGKLLKLDDGACISLPQRGTLPPQAHIFDQRSIDAVNAALAARRPLLVRGEPGTGKSQLARAAAVHLQRPLITKVIDSRTEARDLLWEFDAVARLAEAQLLSAIGRGAASTIDSLKAQDSSHADWIRTQFNPRRFARPGPLWWTLNWTSAQEQLKDLCIPAQAPEAPPEPAWKPGLGTVLLVDEIDKGESDVPNGLLEALGDGVFRPPGFDAAVEFDGGAPPLVIITTNEERALPNAFLRRCFVLKLELPVLKPESSEQERQAFVRFLTARGKAHFTGTGAGAGLSDDVLVEAGNLLVKDRLFALQHELPPPGLAEYLDLLRAVGEQAVLPKAQLALLGKLAEYAYQKHPTQDV